MRWKRSAHYPGLSLPGREKPPPAAPPACWAVQGQDGTPCCHRCGDAGWLCRGTLRHAAQPPPATLGSLPSHLPPARAPGVGTAVGMLRRKGGFTPRSVSLRLAGASAARPLERLGRGRDMFGTGASRLLGCPACPLPPSPPPPPPPGTWLWAPSTLSFLLKRAAGRWG